MLIAQICGEGGASGEKHMIIDHHSACTYSTPRPWGSGGMLPQDIFFIIFTPCETAYYISL